MMMMMDIHEIFTKLRIQDGRDQGLIHENFTGLRILAGRDKGLIDPGGVLGSLNALVNYTPWIAFGQECCSCFWSFLVFKDRI